MEPNEADREAKCEVFMNVSCTSVVHPTCDNTSARNGSLPHVSTESESKARMGRLLNSWCGRRAGFQVVKLS